MASESLPIRRPTRVSGEAAHTLVVERGARPADLVDDIAEAVRWRSLRAVAIPAEVVLHWRCEDSRSWQILLEWLTRMDVEIEVH